MANSFSALVGQRRAQSLLSRGTKTPLNFGPWPQGLVDNLDFALGQITAGGLPGLDFIPDNSVSAINNLSFTRQGTAVSRLGRREYATGIANPMFITLLGTFEEASFDGSKTLYGLIGVTQVSGSTVLLSVIVDISGGFHGFTSDISFTLQQTFVGFSFTDAVKYNNRIYLISPFSGNLSVSSGSRVSASPMVWTAEPNIPVGSKGLIYRERLFVINSNISRVYYSKATDPTTWTAPDGGFFDVNPGDGTVINNVAFTNNMLYIFKDSGTYLFTFTTDPGVDGYLRKITDSSFYDAIVLDDGQVYAINGLGLWKITNTNFSLISHTVNLKPIPRKSRLVAVDKKLYIDNYVYDILTGLWTYHDSIKTPSSNVAWDTKPSIRLTHLQNDYTKDITITEGKTAGSISVISNTTPSAGINYLDFLISDGHWSKPVYALQTRMVRIGSDKWMRLGIPEIEWYLNSAAPFISSAVVKLCRSNSPGVDPSNPDISKLDGNVLNNNAGKLYQANYDSNSAGDLQISKVIPNPAGNASIRSLSAMVQFYSAKLVDAADVRNPAWAYYLALRSLRVLAGIPPGEVNAKANVSF